MDINGHIYIYVYLKCMPTVSLSKLLRVITYTLC